jgi:chaperonin cofactor prefoldin
MNSASQVQMDPTKSQLSNMTGRTYISQLQQQLEEEKHARENLENELSDLKKVSSEILSHLSEIKEHQANLK